MVQALTGLSKAGSRPQGSDGLINVEPRNRFDRSASADSSPDDDAVAGQVGSQTHPSILIVEDEGIVAQDLKEALTRLGYRICGVASEGTQAVGHGQAAAARARRHGCELAR